MRPAFGRRDRCASQRLVSRVAANAHGAVVRGETFSATYRFVMDSANTFP
jgi:hypothetical protein